MNHSSEHAETECLNNTRKNKIKEKKDLLKLEKDRETEDNMLKDVRNLFRLKQEKEVIKEIIIRYIRKLFGL